MVRKLLIAVAVSLVVPCGALAAPARGCPNPRSRASASRRRRRLVCRSRHRSRRPALARALRPGREAGAARDQDVRECSVSRRVEEDEVRGQVRRRRLHHVRPVPGLQVPRRAEPARHGAGQGLQGLRGRVIRRRRERGRSRPGSGSASTTSAAAAEVTAAKAIGAALLGSAALAAGATVATASPFRARTASSATTAIRRAPPIRSTRGWSATGSCSAGCGSRQGSSAGRRTRARTATAS